MKSLVTRRSWTAVVLVACSLITTTAFALQEISAPQVTPSSLQSGVAREVTVSAQVAADADLIGTSINLVRRFPSGDATVLSSMYDDGSHGDAVAGDGTYTIRVTLSETKAGIMEVAATGAYSNQVQRFISPYTSIPIIGVAVVTITSPTSGLVTNSSQVRVTGLTSSNESVRIEGGATTVTNIADSSGNFSMVVPLKTNQVNNLFAIGTDSFGNPTAPQPLNIIQDSQPPNLFIDFPTTNAQIAADTVEVAGRVGDLLSGFMGLSVRVNGTAAAVSVGIGNNGSFDRPNVPLNMGTNTITATATDIAGNTTTKQLSVIRVPLTGPRMAIVSGNGQTTNVHRTLRNPIIVQVTEANGAPIANKLVTFNVTRSDGRLSPDPTVGTAGTLMLQVHTDNSGMARTYWNLGGDAGFGNNRISVASKDISGTILFCASASPGRAGQINIGSGNNQRAEAGGPAPEKLRAWVNDSCNGIPGISVTFSVQEGGGKVNGEDSVTVPTSITGHAEVDFTLGPDAGNNVIVADFPADPGNPATFIIYGLLRDTNKPTSFTGLILDNASQPIGGAFCSLTVGATYLTTTSDGQGQFTFSNTPAGPGDLFLSGGTATSLGGNYVPPNSFPFLSYSVVLVPNAENSLPTPVLLPQLNPTNNRTYFGTNDLVLTCEGIAGLKMTIKANSMRKANGTLVTPSNPAIVSLNQVKHDSVPMPIPDGAAPPFTWTLQPARSTFNPPVQIEYPNMSGLPAGTIAYFLSFNHDTGKFEIIASGHVVDDGSIIVTDPGAGLTLAGWGCNCPPYSVTASCERGCEQCPIPLADALQRQGGCQGCPSDLTIPAITDPDVQAFENNPVQWTSSNSGVQANLTTLQARYGTLTCLARQITGAGGFGVSSVFRPQGYQDHLIAVKRAWRASLRLSQACRQRCSQQLVRITQECGHHGVCNNNPIAQTSRHSQGNAFDVPFGNVGNLTQTQITTLAAQAGLNLLIESTAYHFSIGSGQPTACPNPSPKTSAAAEIVQNSETDQTIELDDPITLADLGNSQVRVNGQTVTATFPEDFKIPNISAADLFGANGPGSPPDFLSDDFLRITGTRLRDGSITYFFTEHFQIVAGQTFTPDEIVYTTTPPPLPVSLRIIIGSSTLTNIGQTTQLHVTGTLQDGSLIDLTPRTNWTVYRTSNPQVATVDKDGLVTARGNGVAYLTAVNNGATAVAQAIVALGPLMSVEGLVRFENGSPAAGAAITIFGLPYTSVSRSDGSFTITNVPSAITSNLTVRAALTIGGTNYLGSSTSVIPVPGGIADAGLITIQRGGGNLGPIIISGMDPEDHGTPGRDMIRDILRFVVQNSALHSTKTNIVMLGGSSSVGSTAASIASGLGYRLTQFSGTSITNVNLDPLTTPYDVIYMPTSDGEISGGITAADIARVNARKADIITFVNRGGGLASFAQTLSGGYGWFPLNGLVTTSSVGGTGIEVTPDGVFILSASATAVEPFHQAFIGPTGFFGLKVLATESTGLKRPLILGGLAAISNAPPAALSLDVPPPMLSAKHMPDGSMEMKVSASMGESYVIEASTNLVNWVPISTNLSADGVIIITDSEATNLPSRFYRAVQGP